MPGLAPTMLSRKPYSGSHCKLVIGFNVGITSSRASYSILCPGDVPVIQGVKLFPGQEQIEEDAKIPSIIYYDSRGHVRAVGAEALLESNSELAKEEQWVQAIRFNGHLCAETGKSREVHDIPPLPPNKTAEEVFGDFLLYLYQCTRSYIRQRHTSMPELLDGQPDFVLTHGNDWGTAQHDQMRRAAVHAGLVSDTSEGYSHIKFVSGGEAILHSCIHNNAALDTIMSGEGVIVVDAGEEVVDLSAFFLKTTPNKFEMVAPPKREFQGSMFVTRRAREFIRSKLHDSQYGGPSDISHITEMFDEKIKLSFKDSSQPVCLDNDSDSPLHGFLELQGSDVATFFEPNIAVIFQAIRELAATARIPVTFVLLVGSFAESDWLFSNLQSRCQEKGLYLWRLGSDVPIDDTALSSLLDCFDPLEAKVGQLEQAMEQMKKNVRNGIDPRQVDDVISELQKIRSSCMERLKLTAESSRVAELEARNRTLEQALDAAERNSQPDVDRRKAEEMPFESRQSHVTTSELSAGGSPMTELETRNSELRRALGQTEWKDDMDMGHPQAEEKGSDLSLFHSPREEKTTAGHSPATEHETGLSNFYQALLEIKNGYRAAFTRQQEAEDRFTELQRVHSSCKHTIATLARNSQIAETQTTNRNLEYAIQHLKSENNKSREHAAELRQALFSSEVTVAALRKDIPRLIALEVRNRELEDMTAVFKENFEKWRTEAAKQKKQALAARARADSINRTLLHLQRENTATVLRLQSAHKELEHRTVVEQFLSSADSFAGVDVTQSVEKLNAHILQCATHLTDKLQPFAQFRYDISAESPASANLVDISSKPYTGLHRKLVVGIDVGTTFSGVSYCILDPGVVPIIQGVNRYPAQQKVGGDAKIPSILYYDSSGLVRAVGAEALQGNNINQATEYQWVKAQWFKLHLRPQPETYEDAQVPPLPPNKTVVQVFGDLLRYLYHCTRLYIQQTHASGLELWESLKSDTEFVLTHPNGWERAQKIQMRKAAIYGGLVPDTPEGRSRLHLLKEGEASLHHCIRNNHISDITNTGEGVIIVDAGGGTIDLSAYCVKSTQNRYVEISPATCYFQGSVFVSHRAQTFLKNKLAGSRYDTPDDISLLAECFDKSTKLSFRDPDQPAYIKFGPPRETDLSMDVKFGQLKLQGSDVATFFEPSISTLQQAIQEQMNAANIPVTSVLLVGGFAASSWLFSNLLNYMSAKNIRLSRPDGHLAKAVANGAVGFLVNRLMTLPTAGYSIRPKHIPNQAGTDSDTMDESSTTSAAQIRESVGDPVLHLLQATRTMEDPSTVVTMAVRACLVSFCYNLVIYSHHRHVNQVDCAFHELFKVLCCTVASPIVANNWSGLTKPDLERLNASQDPTDFTSQVTRLMLEKLSAIVSYLGYPDDIFEELTDELSSRLKSITTSVLELRTALGGKEGGKDGGPQAKRALMKFSRAGRDRLVGDTSTAG